MLLRGLLSSQEIKRNSLGPTYSSDWEDDEGRCRFTRELASWVTFRKSAGFFISHSLHVWNEGFRQGDEDPSSNVLTVWRQGAFPPKPFNSHYYIYRSDLPEAETSLGKILVSFFLFLLSSRNLEPNKLFRTFKFQVKT